MILVENIIIYFLFTVILLCIILMIYAIIYNHFQEYIIRIHEAEAEIDNTLRSKYDLINKCVSIIKGNMDVEKEKDFLDSVIKMRHMKLSNFDFDRKLVELNHRLIEICEEHSEEFHNEEIKKLNKSINDIDNTLTSLKEYYNEHISKYNKLIRIFPTNLVATICKYKEKLYFDRKDMNDEEYEDFKL